MRVVGEMLDLEEDAADHEGFIRAVLAAIEGDDPIRGREILARHIKDRPFVLTPCPDGSYRVDGAFDMGALIAAEGGRVSDNGSRRDRD